MSPEHIVFFTPSAGGGHARYTQELLRALATHPANRGRTFELVSSEDLELAFRNASLPFKVSAVLPPLKHRDKYASKLNWIIGRLTHYPRRERAFLNWLDMRPDITAVHLQEWTPWLATSFIRRIQAMGKRVYYTVHNIYPHRYPPMLPKAAMHRWLRSACQACDGLFVLTPLLREQLQHFLGDASPTIHVVPHGVWRVEPTSTATSMSQRLASRRLLFFGAIRRNKGLDLLLNSMNKLRDYSLTIAGAPLEGDYFRNQIVPKIDALRAAGVAVDLRDRFIDDEELPELFKTHSAVVLPYTAEFNAQSGVIFMAMAHDVPVIASEAGGLTELMQEFKVGLTFRDRTSDGLAAAIEELFKTINPEELESQLHAARKHFSWSTAAAATLEGYDASRQFQIVRTMKTDDRTVQANPAH